MEERYTPQQIADMYSVHPSAVWRWIRNKELRAVKLGRTYSIRKKDLLEFEKEHLTK